MTTKRKHIKQSKVNYFDLGGGITGTLGGISGLIGQGINNLNVPTAQNNKITAINNEQLMTLMQNYKPIELLKSNVGGQALSGAASGASAGMAFGPWGAAIGGVVGGLAGGVTSLIGNSKKQQQEQLLKNQQMGNFKANIDGIQGMNNINLFANYAANGGYLYDQGGNLYANLPNLATHGGEFGNGGVEVNAGGTHELNPNGGVPMGIAQDGKPNLVEEGEFKFKDYIFSNRLKYDDNTSFADMAKKESKESSERPNDPISKNGLDKSMSKLQLAQEILKLAQGIKEGNSFWPGGTLGRGLINLNLMNLKITNPGTTLPFNDKNQFQTKPMGFDPNNVFTSGTYATANKGDFPLNQTPQLNTQLTQGVNGLNQNNLLRYAPIAASGLASITDALGVTNTPDYSAVQDLLGLDLLRVKGSKLGDYVSYKPLDTNYLTNQLGANAASTRAGLRNASGGNRATYMAGLLGADASYNEGLGKLGRLAAESNQSLRMQVADFNRGTNQFNAQLSNWELGINTQMKADSIKTKAQLKAAARQESRGAKMNNLNTFVEGLGDFGKEKDQKAIINWMIEKGLFGTVKSYGGKLNTKKK